MNAHHKKASYRPPPPKSLSRYAAGTSELAVVEGAGGAGGQQGLRRLAETAQRLPFGWQFDAIIPSIGASSSTDMALKLKAALAPNASFYLCEQVNLADILEPAFLSSFVRQGSLVALSTDDAEVIEISLTDPAFRAGKPGFERTKRLLRDWPTRTDLLDALQGQGVPQEGKRFDLLMAYTDEAGAAQPITFPSSIRSRVLSSSVTLRTLPSLAVPASNAFPRAEPPTKRARTSSGAFRRAVEQDDPARFWDEYREWAGLIRLGGDAEEKLRWTDAGQEGEEGWGLGRELCEKGEVTVLSCDGLLHPKMLSRALEDVLTGSNLSALPFLSLSLTPFPHAPLSHLSSVSPPVVGTSKRPNGKKRKRGRGRGEEEEADRERMEDEGGWEAVLRPQDGGNQFEWHIWEGL
ncbi:hypothetical protein Rhopal_002124-T1 [Rhodotorula paludigena]|uniref:Uncharacterized protein n=1 Tax=Rhodotorula paludigena TaxID=86838 RepID=A0AAV5G9F5_9BASI|nr:hypothetical protein Rhopal_002124-T1 [Rhodotorula paludigena]